MSGGALPKTQWLFERSTNPTRPLKSPLRSAWELRVCREGAGTARRPGDQGVTERRRAADRDHCPKTESVKLAFMCTVVLKAELERYAAMHTQACVEPVDAETLIPRMLKTFMARNRGSGATAAPRPPGIRVRGKWPG